MTDEPRQIAAQLEDMMVEYDKLLRHYEEIVEENRFVRANFESLIYCITTRPRSFRWRDGQIEWKSDGLFGRWRKLPMTWNEMS